MVVMLHQLILQDAIEILENAPHCSWVDYLAARQKNQILYSALQPFQQQTPTSAWTIVFNQHPTVTHAVVQQDSPAIQQV